jgi:hypothetical protein
MDIINPGMGTVMKAFPRSGVFRRVVTLLLGVMQT